MPVKLSLKPKILPHEGYIWGCCYSNYPYAEIEISNRLPLILQVYTIIHEIGHWLIDGFCNDSYEVHEVHDYVDFRLTEWLFYFVRNNYLKN